ncbi:MAG TPA: FprA family A-type flavoprotein [Lachnospiraceae bacterium]|nr:FprA family A-type flavoprotein [Lachnospiraceae bacterium]
MHIVRKVTDNLYWIGANDHRLTLFENIHPIPEGVSYNSYLLLDRKTVMFDTVDWDGCRQMMENLEYVLDGRELDTVVVNHWEPDHAASLQVVLNRYPKAEIISTEKGFMLMKQFGFHADGHKTITVKEGDKTCFGEHTVTYLEAPMVHWPEAMVTLDLTNGALFSADAFGSFKALDGRLFNDEVNYDRDWIDSNRRYLTNIVGKYGPHIRKLLNKAAPVLDQIKFICPLHGLVWRNNLDYLLDKYNHWASYEPEEKGVMIVYASMYGNTEQAAQAIAAKLAEKGIRNVSLFDVSSTHVSYLIAEVFRVSHVILASCTYNLGIFPPMLNFLEDMKALNVQNRVFALIENGSWAIRSGDLIHRFLDEEMKTITVLNERVTVASHLGENQEEDLGMLADAVADSLRG